MQTIKNMALLACLVTNFDPLSISGCKLWLKADAGITKDGSDLVSNWADQSGVGNDVAQATGTKKPLWVNNQYNNLPTVRFDGIDDFLQKQPTTGFSQPLTVFIVCKIPASGAITGNEMIFMAGTVGGGTRNQFYVTSSDIGMYAGAGPITGGSLPPNILAYFTTVFNGASSSARRNGSSLISTGNAGTFSPNGITLASQDAGADYCNIDICEILVYASSLTSVERDNVENYLKNRWGL